MKYFPQIMNAEAQWGGHLQLTHPAAIFLKKYRDLIKKGYRDTVAFDKVVDDISEMINK